LQLRLRSMQPFLGCLLLAAGTTSKDVHANHASKCLCLILPLPLCSCYPLLQFENSNDVGEQACIVGAGRRRQQQQCGMHARSSQPPAATRSSLLCFSCTRTDPACAPCGVSVCAGVFAQLTNAYAVIALGGAENFYSVFESELSDHIPVIKTSIAGTRLVGRMTVGNKNGLLVPNSTTDQVGGCCVAGHLACLSPFLWLADRIPPRLDAASHTMKHLRQSTSLR
jgi:hypothetical protein